MTKREERMVLLYIGSPPPYSFDYQMGCIEILFGKYSKWTQEKRDKEHKRRLKLYKKDCKKYLENRKKELDELDKLLKEEKK